MDKPMVDNYDAANLEAVLTHLEEERDSGEEARRTYTMVEEETASEVSVSDASRGICSAILTR